MVSFLDSGDQTYDYRPWSCSDQSQLDTIEISGEVTEPEHPHGWEPSNIEREPTQADLQDDNEGTDDIWDT